MSQTHPFSGLLVVDYTHVLAGPACSYYLGLLGAEVIKVESATKGDAIRHRGGTDSEAAKAGQDDIAQFHQLLERADVLVENHIPETMRRLKLDEDSLADRHPHLIHCAMTGYGRGGPQENTAAYDVNIQAACGLMEATGTQESGPIRTGAPVTFIDVSMLETGLSLMSSSVTDFLKTGNSPERRGNLANSRSPGAGSFPCKEGVMSLGVNEESHFKSLADALGRQDWLTDPRYAERTERKIHALELAAEIESELSERTAMEWEPVLQSAGVPSARLRSLPEALTSVQVQVRGYVQTTDDGIDVPTLPFRLGGAGTYSPVSKAPTHGEHNAEIEEWLKAT